MNMSFKSVMLGMPTPGENDSSGLVESLSEHDKTYFSRIVGNSQATPGYLGRCSVTVMPVLSGLQPVQRSIRLIEFK